MSKRTDQMSSVLHRAIQSVINDGLSDARLEGTMLTVTDVNVTTDMRTAVVRVSVLPEKKQKLAWHALKDASRHVRRHAAELVTIHRLPELIFKLDTSLKKQAAVLEAISRGAAEIDDAIAEEDTGADQSATDTQRNDPEGETGS